MAQKFQWDNNFVNFGNALIALKILLPYEVGVYDNAQNHILILTTKLSRLSKISRYL